MIFETNCDCNNGMIEYLSCTKPASYCCGGCYKTEICPDCKNGIKSVEFDPEEFYTIQDCMDLIHDEIGDFDEVEFLVKFAHLWE